MRPPLFYRLFNAVRRYVEDRSAAEDANLVKQWKAAYAPEPKVKTPIPFLNLRIIRGGHKERAA
jgi:hypothetical protein